MTAPFLDRRSNRSQRRPNENPNFYVVLCQACGDRHDVRLGCREQVTR